MAEQKRKANQSSATTRTGAPKTRGSKAPKGEPVILPTIGAEGDVCTECGNQLATDQRYCLNCGQRRAGPRVEYDGHLENPGPDAHVASAAPAQQPVARSGEWTPRNAAVSIAALGVMLLVGVLIGRDDSPQQVASQEPIVIQGGAAGTGTPTSAAATKSGDAAAKNASANQPPPAESAEGAEVIDPNSLGGQSSADYSETSKNLPDVIALPGEPPPEDNKQPGGGSQGTVVK